MHLHCRVSLSCAVFLAIVASAVGHGGTMHSASHDDTSAKASAGSCSSWVSLSTTSSTKAQASKITGAGRHLLAAINADGFARMVVRLDDNCTGDYTTSVLINVTLSDGSVPLSGVNVNGSVNTGKCSTGGGSAFLLDPAENATDHNKLFFKAVETDDGGRVLGSFANDGIVRVSGNGSAKSVVLYRADGTPLVCCDLVTTAPAEGFEEALAPAGKNCTAGEEGGNQLGMLMDGKWMPCTLQINGSYWMKHGDEYLRCLDYRNGTQASADTGAPDQIGMIMDNVWKPCKVFINGSFWMMHDASYARCSEYRNGTIVGSAAATATAGGATSGNRSASGAGAAAGRPWLVTMLLVGAACLNL